MEGQKSLRFHSKYVICESEKIFCPVAIEVIAKEEATDYWYTTGKV